MFDSATTKIMDSLVKNDFLQAETDLPTIQDNLETYPLLNYLILLHQNTGKAIEFWDNADTSKIDALFQDIITAYNLYVTESNTELLIYLQNRIKSPIHNYLEASNLSFYAHFLNLPEQIHLLSKTKELKVPSELLLPEKQESDFLLFQPITLLKVHYQVIQFLKNNFEDEQDLENFVQKMNTEKPI